MSYTKELLHEKTGVRVLVSDFFGVGFSINDENFKRAVTNRDESMWEILDWMVSDVPHEINDANNFYECTRYDRDSKSSIVSSIKHYDPLKLVELLNNPYLDDVGKSIIRDYFSGKLEQQARDERKAEKKNKKGKSKVVSGFIYLIQAENGLYKIGKAKNVSERMKPFSVNFPMRWELVHSFPADDYTEAESELHFNFGPKQDVGEWFRLDSNDIDYLRSINKFEFGEFLS